MPMILNQLFIYRIIFGVHFLMIVHMLFLAIDENTSIYHQSLKSVLPGNNCQCSEQDRTL